MPVVSVRIDAESSYTIHFEDEYSFPDFVKTIEKHVHVINEIVASKSGPAAAQGQETPEADNAPKDQGITAPPETDPEKRFTTETGGEKMGKRRTLTAVLAVLLLVLGGGLLLRFVYVGNSEVGKGGAAIAEKAAQVQKNPIAAPAESPPAPLPELNRLLIEARETAWIKVAEDYNPAYRIVLKPGERLEREATRFVLQIGNAKGVDISFNDERISAIRPGTKSTGKVISLTLPGKIQTGREFNSAGKQTRQ
jgi:hypothetical protein